MFNDPASRSVLQENVDTSNTKTMRVERYRMKGGRNVDAGLDCDRRRGSKFLNASEKYRSKPKTDTSHSSEAEAGLIHNDLTSLVSDIPYQFDPTNLHSERWLDLVALPALALRSLGRAWNWRTRGPYTFVSRKPLTNDLMLMTTRVIGRRVFLRRI